MRIKKKVKVSTINRKNILKVCIANRNYVDLYYYEQTNITGNNNRPICSFVTTI